MIVTLDLITGICAGVEYIEDDDFHYIMVEALILRFGFCFEKPKE